MRCYWLILLAAAGICSCAQRGRVQAAEPNWATPPQPTFERQIRNAIDAGDGDYTLRLLREKLAAEPDNLQVRLDLAKAYRQRGFPEVALEHYRLAAQRFPDSEAVALELAKSLRAAGQRVEAAHGLDVFLAAHPQKPSPEMLSWLGIFRDELGQWAEGERAHRAAVDAAPQSDYLHNNLGFNLLKQKRDQEAASEFRRALELNPASALARNNLAQALASSSAQALGEWSRLYDHATAHSNLAAVLIDQGRYREARAELDQALGYNRFHSAALSNLKLVSELDGRPALINGQPADRRWPKWLSPLRFLFVEPPPPDSKLAAPIVSSNNGRGL